MMKIAIPDLVSPSYFPAEAAVELGCFAAYGVDAEIELISPVERAYEAMREGAVDIVAGSAHSALSAFPRWEGVKLLCAQSQGMYWFLIMNAALGATRGDMNAVKGRRIGAAPWVGMGLKQMLVRSGIDLERDRVTIAPTPGSLEPRVNFGLAAVRALEAGIVDGFWANGMGAAIATETGVGTLVLDARRGDGPKEAFNYTMATLATTDRLLAENRELAKIAVRAVTDAQKILIADPGRAREVGEKLFPEEAGRIEALIRRDIPFYQADLTPDFVAGMNDFARALGILDVDVPYSAVVAEGMERLW
ncbi:ABC transporter substrate-binding protein [Ancylobacter sp. MQZ15Z-1]|uniref:ABC transporter substrate-binding protein n=1 Tax=Ancylobacter mangrovi TaxID=2972472 RepID=A0A9X2T6L5_9HYPH|nr:ABC transporter substrate-binding protein [Ancylobacter mangrovi]MCS0496509.1 ABC transporter substrate-binding protein [Ancylobacter mangrovi]